MKNETGTYLAALTLLLYQERLMWRLQHEPPKNHAVFCDQWEKLNLQRRRMFQSLRGRQSWGR